MKRIETDRIFRALWYAVVILVSYLLQAMVFPYLPVFGAKPLILPVSAMAIAVYEGHVRGGAWGLAAGVLCDCALNQPTIQFTLTLLVLGVGVGLLGETLLNRGYASYAVTCAAGLLLCALIQTLRPLLYGGANLFLVLGISLVQTLYSMIFSIPAYLSVRRISRITRF